MGRRKKILNSPQILKIRPKVFSTIIETRNRKKKNNFFNNDHIKKMLVFLEEQIEIKKDPNNVIAEFLSNLKSHNQTNLNNKEISLKKRIFFNNNLLLKIIENREESLTIKEIKEEYKMFYLNSKFSDSTLRRHLIEELGFTFKKSAVFNEKAFGIDGNLLNITFIDKYCDLLKNNHEILYLDESSFVNNMISMKSWCRKNTKVKRSNIGREKSNSVMAVINKSGILHYEINEGRNNSTHFVSYMNNLEIKIKQDENLRKKLNRGLVTVILDNAKLHVSKYSKRNMKKNLINRVYLPPYKPQLNPIELLWNVIKMKRRRKILKTK